MTAGGRRVSSLPLSLPPRGLSRVQAAEYVGLSPSKFDELVRDRRMPKPKRVDARTIWDRLALDEAFSALEEEDDDDTPAKRNPWEGF